MDVYRIVFTEFTKYKDDAEYKSFMSGMTDRIYKTELECSKIFEEEYNYIMYKMPYYEKVEELYVGKYEFKLKGIIKDGRKEVIHHYKMIRFNV